MIRRVLLFAPGHGLSPHFMAEHAGHPCQELSHDMTGRPSGIDPVQERLSGICSGEQVLWLRLEVQNYLLGNGRS